MKSNQIFRISGKGGVLCSILANAGKNATTLRPLAQLVQRLETARKNAKFCQAMSDQYIDAEIAVTFESGNTVPKRFRRVLIDLSSGREPHLVFTNTPDGNETVSVPFTTAVCDDWIKPRANAGCLDCGGKYTCPVCESVKEPLAA